MNHNINNDYARSSNIYPKIIIIGLYETILIGPIAILNIYIEVAWEK